MCSLKVGGKTHNLERTKTGKIYVVSLEKEFGNTSISLGEFTKGVQQISVIFEIKSNRTSVSQRGVLVMHCDLFKVYRLDDGMFMAIYKDFVERFVEDISLHEVLNAKPRK